MWHSADKVHRGDPSVFHQFQESKKLCINGVCLEFLSKFLSHNSKKLGRGTLLCFRNFLVSKNCLDKRVGRGRGIITTFRQKTFVSQCRRSSDEKSLAFHPFQVSKYFMNTTGMSRFFVEDFLSHSTKKPRRGTLLSFRKFPVSKKIMDKKCGVGGVSQYTLRNVLSYSAERNCRGIP